MRPARAMEPLLLSVPQGERFIPVSVLRATGPEKDPLAPENTISAKWSCDTNLNIVRLG